MSPNAATRFGPRLTRKLATNKPDGVRRSCSPAAYNGRVGLAVLCPITTQAKGYPLEVAIPPGLKVEGVVLDDPVRSIDWRGRNVARICELPEETVAEVVETLAELLSPQY